MLNKYIAIDSDASNVYRRKIGLSIIYKIIIIKVASAFGMMTDPLRRGVFLLASDGQTILFELRRHGEHR